MKVTREIVRNIAMGDSWQTECTPAEMQVARTIVSQVSMLDDTTYKVSYDRDLRILKISHLKPENNN